METILSALLVLFKLGVVVFVFIQLLSVSLILALFEKIGFIGCVLLFIATSFLIGFLVGKKNRGTK